MNSGWHTDSLGYIYLNGHLIGRTGDMTLYEDRYSAGGWYCGKCGAFVPNNTNHECSPLSGATDKIEYSYSYPTDRELLLKILEKLDEILTELKK